MDYENGEDAVEETPEEVAARMVKMEAFSIIIKGKRKVAVDGRTASGIEDEWQEDEDHYEGVDDFNRTARRTKPRSSEGGVTTGRQSSPTGSTVFLKITRPYCDAAAARVGDMLLPTDDRNWAIRPTPVPSLVKAKEDTTQAVDEAGQPMMQPAPMPENQPMPQEQPKPGMIRGMVNKITGQQAPEQAAPPQVPVTNGDIAKQQIAEAVERAERAQETIDDWLVECRYHAEVRKVIESSARMGSGILKGPVPIVVKSKAVRKTEDGWTMAIEEKTVPSSVAVDLWNFFPDPECGQNIQDGSYVFERGDITRRRLEELKGGDYIDEAIDLCLEEGPTNSSEEARRETKRESGRTLDADRFEIWYFHGIVSTKEMEAAGCAHEDDKDSYPCIVTMVNDRVIKIAMSPLDTGAFPYDVMVWQDRLDHWAGVGVARQMRECQKGANAAVRQLMDNSAVSGGPQIIMDTSKIEPANGKYEIRPLKIWRTKQDSQITGDIRHAFTIVTIETRQAELMAVLNWWLKEAEDVTGLPMLLQGQQGKAPDTVGGMNILNNNGSAVLRRIARNYDDRVTEPHIGRYYEWMLLHGPEDSKGEFTIDARGSSALIERDMQSNALMQLVGLSINPAYGLDPEAVIQEVLKSMRFDPKKLEFSEEKKEEMAQRQPPPDPRITVAEMNLAMKEKIAAGEMQHEQFMATMADENADQDRAMRSEEIQGKLAGQVDALKARLAEVSMKLKVQQEESRKHRLQSDDHTKAGYEMGMHNRRNPVPKQTITPAVEPVGRAPDGQAFTK